MRRALALSVVAAALAAPAAQAALAPVERTFGEREVPRVRTGEAPAPTVRRGAPRIVVLLRLRSAPLAAWGARTPAALGPGRRLNVESAAARSYLETLAAEQAAAEHELLAAVPGARLLGRHAVLVNALAASVPARSFGRLHALPSVSRVYPSFRYTLALDRSPGVIGVTDFGASTGARGEGVKIAVVDDGLDVDHSFLRPAGLAAPPGFPRGQRRYTSGKVIVARSFPAPGAGPEAALPFDPDDSFHGTHVAGIAAGAAGTTAAKGLDHPRTEGLSGVAPRAWLGNYRVFSLPTPVGNVANTPEIVAAFEAAVRDGMDVINFSGGGPEIDPVSDALVEVIRNVARAGVVAVIAAGNDRDDFGAGSVGSPGTAPDAIAVAAVTNERVFAPALSVREDDAPTGLAAIPYVGADGTPAPRSWSARDHRLVDVGALANKAGAQVDRRLCSPGRDPNGSESPLRPGALRGAIALVERGSCTFASKAERAARAGAVGLVVIDNRPGEANAIPLALDLPAITVADADGAALVAYLATRDGRARIRAGRDPLALATERSGVVTSFSSQGPTPFAHALKPDVAAPGGQILSATLRGIVNSPFAVFDGTSMATPHVAGAAALLLERHPGWAPWQVKSALVSTAGTAWADTTRTVEAPVTLAGGGLVDVPLADDPLVVTRPASLSFGDLDASAGAAASALPVTVADVGGGAGTWSVTVRPQSAPAGVAIEAPTSMAVPAGGSVDVLVTARAAADAAAGDASGFLELRLGDVVRRIPYLALVVRPRLAALEPIPLAGLRAGSTRGGPSRVDTYRFPLAPFGPAPDYVGPPLVESGRERLYTFLLDRPALNAGVAVVAATGWVDPFLLARPDESAVQGFTGTPAVVNGLLDTYGLPSGAAGASFPRPGRYYAAVDSPRDPFTGVKESGLFVVHDWVDDLAPPTVRLLTPRVVSRRGVVALRVLDRGAGADPLSILVAYGNALLGASSYDPVTGLALVPIPSDLPLEPGRNRLTIAASDRQEAKNVNTLDADVLPNTSVVGRTVTVAPDELSVALLAPGPEVCVVRGEPAELVAYADGPAPVERVRFLVGGRQVAVTRRGERGVFIARYRPRGGARLALTAVAEDTAGRQVASPPVRVALCR